MVIMGCGCGCNNVVCDGVGTAGLGGASMVSCSNCGNSVKWGAVFCAACGAGGEVDGGGFGAVRDLPFVIPVRRVVLMMVLTYGVYLFYWLYLTWKQYREYTGYAAYPVWHVLTQLVPVYCFFRIHAHMRVYRELTQSAGMVSGIQPGLAVAAMVLAWLVRSAAYDLGGGWGDVMSASRGLAVVVGMMEVGTVLLVTWLLLVVQGNLNRLWGGLAGVRAAVRPVGKLEVLLGMAGVVLWCLLGVGLVVG